MFEGTPEVVTARVKRGIEVRKLVIANAPRMMSEATALMMASSSSSTSAAVGSAPTATGGPVEGVPQPRKPEPLVGVRQIEVWQAESSIAAPTESVKTMVTETFLRKRMKVVSGCTRVRERGSTL